MQGAATRRHPEAQALKLTEMVAQKIGDKRRAPQRSDENTKGIRSQAGSTSLAYDTKNAEELSV